MKTETLDPIRARLYDAFRSPAFPCNPRPFLHELLKGCEEEGTGWIGTDTAARLMLTLMQMTWGQASTVDSVREYARLDGLFPE